MNGQGVCWISGQGVLQESGQIVLQDSGQEVLQNSGQGVLRWLAPNPACRWRGNPPFGKQGREFLCWSAGSIPGELAVGSQFKLIGVLSGLAE